MSARAEMDAAVAEPRYVIERGVPLPPKGASGLADELRKLEVGDCLRAIRMTPRERVSVSDAARKVGIKVATRKLPEGGYGIWRIA